MRRIALGCVVLAAAVAGCGGRSIYRNVGVGQPGTDPQLTRTSVESRERLAGSSATSANSAGGMIDANEALGPRFARGAVPDSEMLRTQSEAGYRDPTVPY